VSRYFHIGDLVKISPSASEKYRYPDLIEHTGIVIDALEDLEGLRQIKVMWTAANDEGWHPDMTLELISRLASGPAEKLHRGAAALDGNSTVDPHK